MSGELDKHSRADFLLITFTPLEEVKYHSLIGSFLNKKGFRVWYFASSRMVKKQLIKRGAVDVYCPEDFRQILSKDLKVCCRKLGIPSLRFLYLPELAYLDIKENPKNMCAMTKFYLNIATYFLGNFKPKCIVYGQGAKLLSRCFYYVSRQLNIPNLIVGFSLFPDTSFIYTDEMGIQREVKNLWENFTYSESDLCEARQFVKEYKLHKKTFFRPKNNIMENVKAKYKVLRLGIQQSIEKELPFPHTFDFLNLLRRHMKKRINYIRNRMLIKLLSKKSKKMWSQEYIYFPMYFSDESLYTVRARPFVQQEYLIELISRSIPEGINIYVKPHPEQLHSYGLLELIRINKHPNIRIIDPGISSHRLLNYCKAVIVTSGTSGFEGILYQKPVIVFGHPFYRGFGLTYDVTCLDDLEFQIKEALSIRLDEISVLKFVAFLKKISSKGNYNNISELSNSLIEKYKK